VDITRSLPFHNGIVHLFTGILILCSLPQARTVRIGVYDNSPKVCTNRNTGVPAGIFIDVIEYVAQKENWSVVYVEGTWHEGLERLSRGEIDCMPDVAFSNERNTIFDFNKIPVLDSWLQVYCRKGQGIQMVSDLAGKSVAVLDGSIQQKICDSLQRQFAIGFSTIPLPDYASTIKSVEKGEADAVIVGRFHGYSTEKSLRLDPCPVIFNPTSLHFAVPEGKNGDLIGSIDHHVAAMLNNPNSVYYKSINRWLYKDFRGRIPGNIIYLLQIIAGIAIVLIVVTIVLKHQVASRTKELRENNGKLQEMIKRLELAHQKALAGKRMHTLGQLTSGIAHDFNNLLSPIVSYTDLMLSGTDELKDEASIRKNLQTIHNAALHGAELVARMRNFSRNSQLDNTKMPVDINGLIDEALELARMRWTISARKPIDVVRDFTGGIMVAGNKSQLHEMVLNLLLNASDAMPEGGKIQLRSRKKESAAIIEVMDSGTGMSEEVLQNCSKPFYSTKGEFGTGMGLAMVGNIVREHDGSIEIRSILGEGTVFTISFPAVK
jgi:signal transduction histidine kinase